MSPVLAQKRLSNLLKITQHFNCLGLNPGLHSLGLAPILLGAAFSNNGESLWTQISLQLFDIIVNEQES